MIAHIVLLQPRPGSDGGASGATRSRQLGSGRGRRARRSARFRLGRRVKHGLPGYEQMMTQDYEFALIIEVDDVAGADAVSAGAGARALGDLFYTATSAALAYDYEMP